MKFNIFDAHAHYDDGEFDKDRETVLRELKSNGIVGILNCGASIEGSRASVKLAQNNTIFYAAVGIHPEYANCFYDKTVKEIKNLAGNLKVKAIGEIGLDYYYKENPPRNVQRKVFIRQMEMAEELGLPVIIHDREAHGDTFDIISQFKGRVKGEIHCFSGSVEFARECIKLGYYIGFTGVVTFKNARKIIEVAREIPVDRILVETDCPYMAPVPFRGKRNRSEYIESIIEKIAAIKNMDPRELAEATIKNVRTMIHI